MAKASWHPKSFGLLTQAPRGEPFLEIRLTACDQGSIERIGDSSCDVHTTVETSDSDADTGFDGKADWFALNAGCCWIIAGLCVVWIDLGVSFIKKSAQKVFLWSACWSSNAPF